LSLKKLYN